jgi:hypothetical protein
LFEPESGECCFNHTIDVPRIYALRSTMEDIIIKPDDLAAKNDDG